MFGRLTAKAPRELAPVAAADGRPDPDVISWTGDYRSFDEALAACGGDPGYHGAVAVDRYVRRYNEVIADPEKYIANNEHLIRYLAALGAARPIDGEIRVLDFGGGYGAIYELVRRLLPGHASARRSSRGISPQTATAARMVLRD